mmetsp:Transcript_35317/g.97761  ORF Transcript_35317/g.97761 Transcript_35317/m.97761 type:complete len:223 (-) Transcript_35317:608-1276(-)
MTHLTRPARHSRTNVSALSSHESSAISPSTTLHGRALRAPPIVPQRSASTNIPRCTNLAPLPRWSTPQQGRHETQRRERQRGWRTGDPPKGSRRLAAARGGRGTASGRAVGLRRVRASRTGRRRVARTTRRHGATARHAACSARALAVRRITRPEGRRPERSRPAPRVADRGAAAGCSARARAPRTPPFAPPESAAAARSQSPPAPPCRRRGCRRRCAGALR